MKPSEKTFLYPYFLGTFAENDQIFESLLLEFFRDHAYWRRNFHPEDPPPIPTNAPYTDLYNQFHARMQQELHRLSADLKRSVPYFSPRYMGQMASDFLLPAHLAQIMTSFYHPNNVYEDTVPTTMAKESEVGSQLATMFGLPSKSKDQRHAWGHLTSGGATANYEGLWHLQTAKFMPITIYKALTENNLDLDEVGPLKQSLSHYSLWELLNFSLQDVVSMWRKLGHFLKDNRKHLPLKSIMTLLKTESLDHQGYAAFFRNNPELKPPLVLVSKAATIAWRKAVNFLGIGRNQLVKIPTDHHMRMDLEALQKVLDKCLSSQTPVLLTTGILGTLHFGSIDPIGSLVEMRNSYYRKGLFFGLHIDASWGGYLASMFRKPNGELVERHAFRDQLKYFPQADTFQAFASLSQVDSITVDPQKLGYLPFPCGAFISREGGVLDFFWLQQMLFDGKDFAKTPLQEKFAMLTQFSLEGAKPGSAAASTFVTHKCIPLHKQGFGQVLQLTMEASEYFFDKIQATKKELENFAHIVLPFQPDTNILCFGINPKGNRNLAIMNHFSKKIFKHLKFDPDKPLQAHEFFVSTTELSRAQLTNIQAQRVCELMGIDPSSYCLDVKDKTTQSRNMFLFRHAVLNPWLLFKGDNKEENYIDQYFNHFVALIKQELSEAIRKART